MRLQAKKKRAVRRITTARRAELHRLAGILCDFLPLTSYSDWAVTFTTIFRESSVEKYLRHKGSKQQKLKRGFTDVYRYHQRLPKMLIRKIIPAAIDYRMHERRPLTRKELNDLSDCLLKLEIDMRDELRDVALDATLPRITVPPDELVKRLRNHNLDPAISSEPFQLFKDGHFNEATRRAGEKFEDQVQQYSQISKIGRSLMGDAFTNDHLMDISGIQPKNQQGFTEGYKLLTMGAMAAIRNVFSHGNEERRTPEECYEMLMFFNWLFRYLKSPEGTDIT